MQAFCAGLVGGIGRGFSANSNSFLSGTTTIVNGERQKLSTGDIAKGGIGEGVSQAGDMLSQYLIERAEQYQPVIEMPRSEEHTSELQSLMRNSYAVFCLKQKTSTRHIAHTTQTPYATTYKLSQQPT